MVKKIAQAMGGFNPHQPPPLLRHCTSK